MARRRYQEGRLFVRGRAGRRKVWVVRWREDLIAPDGAIKRTMRLQVLGSVSDTLPNAKPASSSTPCYDLPIKGLTVLLGLTRVRS